MSKYILFIAASLLLFTACGETLEDTYKDYSGDGEIRYVGKVKDLQANPGWERVTVNWVNSDDPIVDQVEVKWTSDDVRDSVFLPAGTTSFDITGLTSGSSLQIDVMSVDKKLNESIPVTAYVRAYNQDHEMVQAFNRIVSRYFFLHDHLLLTFVGWDSQVEEAYVSYTHKSTGKEGKFELTKDVVSQLHADIPDVDSSKPVKVYRTGRIEGCDDLINFDPIELDTDRAFNSEFKQELKRQFGYDELVPDEFVNSVKTFDLDWDISDFADLLYFPNLKVLNLGKNRYVKASQVDTKKGRSAVANADLCDWVISELHKINGLTVNRYDNHFNELDKTSVIKEMGHQAEPALKLLSLKGATVEVSPAEDEDLTAQGWSSHESALIDGNDNTSWLPYTRSKSTTFTITIKLKEPTVVHGMRLAQSYYVGSESTKHVLNPSYVYITKSDNGTYYTIATNLEQTFLGNSTGEINIIPFAKAEKTQYIRVKVTTPMFYKDYQVSLAGIDLY